LYVNVHSPGEVSPPPLLWAPPGFRERTRLGARIGDAAEGSDIDDLELEEESEWVVRVFGAA
jgi:hypothetical protein